MNDLNFNLRARHSQWYYNPSIQYVSTKAHVGYIETLITQ